MIADASAPRWLIVGRRDKLELYRDLTRAFERVAELAVLLDRRPGRQRESPAEQRRAPLSAAECELWETVGFRLIPPVVVGQRPAAR